MPVYADHLVFVEDPGAANFMAPLVRALREDGAHVVLLAGGLAHERLRRSGLETLSAGARSAAALLAEYPVRTVLVGTAENEDTLALALVAEARCRNLVSVGVVDAAMNADRRFRGRARSAVAYLPDWVFVADEWTRDAMLAAGAPAERVAVCGNPHTDEVAAAAASFAGRADVRRCRVPDAAPHQQVIVFVSEGSARTDRDHRYADGFAGCTLRPTLTRTGRSEILLEALLQGTAAMQPRPYIVLRVHPKDDIADYDAFRGEIDAFDVDADPLELVYCADLVAGGTSMLLQEAAWVGTPTLSIVPTAAQAQWLPGVRAGITPAVTSMDQLRAMLPRSLGQGHGPIERPSGVAQRTLKLLHAITTAPVAGAI